MPTDGFGLRSPRRAQRVDGACTGPSVLELIAELVPQAIGMAASPLPLIAVLLIILSPNGRGRSIAFAAGRVLAVLATVLAVAALSDVATQGSGGTRVGAAIRLVLGVVFVLLALSKFRSRPKSEAEPKTPGWMQALDGMKPAKALRTGFLVTAVNPKELIFGIAAGVVIGSSTLPLGMVSVALLIYTGIATITVVGPVVAYLHYRRPRCAERWNLSGPGWSATTTSSSRPSSPSLAQS